MLIMKRPHSPDSVDGHCCQRNDCNPTFILDSESPLPTDEDSGECETIQLASTASPKDTNDASSDTGSDSPETDAMEVEFEVVDSYSDEKLLTNCDSSGTDDMIYTAAKSSMVKVAAELWDREKDFWADCSNMDSSGTSSTLDNEEHVIYRECAHCKENCAPHHLYCRMCFELRRGYLPDRPKRENPRQRKRTKELQKTSVLPTSDRCVSMFGELGAHYVGSDLKARSEIASISTKAKSRTPLVKDGDSEGFCELPKALCFLCFSQPRNGGFVHKKTVHVLCCYQCAVRTWNATGKCPMCQKRSQNVAKIIYG